MGNQNYFVFITIMPITLMLITAQSIKTGELFFFIKCAQVYIFNAVGTIHLKPVEI